MPQRSDVSVVLLEEEAVGVSPRLAPEDGEQEAVEEHQQTQTANSLYSSDLWGKETKLVAPSPQKNLAHLIYANVSEVEMDPTWIRIQELCGSGSVFVNFVYPDPYSEYGSTQMKIR